MTILTDKTELTTLADDDVLHVVDVSDTTSNAAGTSFKSKLSILKTFFLGGFTTGSIPFADALGALTEDNDNLFYDDTNDRLGLGTTLPAAKLDVAGSVIIDAGSGSTATGDSALSGGTNSVASNTNAFAYGENARAEGVSSSSWGKRSKSVFLGQMSLSSGRFASIGDCQTSQVVVRNQTSNATPTELFVDGISARLVIPNGFGWGFEVMVGARRSDANDESGLWKFDGMLDRNSNVTALVGGVLKTAIAKDIPAWDVNITADAVNNSLKIEVTGEAAKSINWTAYTRLVEIGGAAGFSNTLSTTFDGVDEQVQRGNTTSFAFERTSAFSLSIWFKIASLSTQSFMSKRGSSGVGYVLSMGSTGRISLILEGSGGDSLEFDSPSGTITTGSWHNIIATYDGTSTLSGARVYFDGVLQAKENTTDTLSTSMLAGTREFKIGAHGTAGALFDGNIDEPSVWNAELTSADVTSIYNSGVPTDLLTHAKTANNIAWWRAGDGDSSPTWTDNKASENMTMTNMNSSNFVVDTP